jgi:hypothetical protein
MSIRIEDKLFESLKNSDFESFQRYIHDYINEKFYYKIRQLAENLFFEDMVEASNEVFAYFLEHKMNSIKSHVERLKIDPKYLISYLHTTLKHCIQDVHKKNPVYNIKNRLSKEIRKTIKESKNLAIENNRVIVLSKPQTIEIQKKANNLLGISNKDIENLIIKLSEGNEYTLSSIIQKSYDFLEKNGYINLDTEIEFVESYDSDSEDEIHKKVSSYTENIDIKDIYKQDISKAAYEFAKTLTEMEKQIFLLYFYHGEEPKTIVQKIGISNANLTYYINKVTKYIKVVFNKYDLEQDERILEYFLEISNEILK